jgi:hypothetical protein
MSDNICFKLISEMINQVSNSRWSDGVLRWEARRVQYWTPQVECHSHLLPPESTCSLSLSTPRTPSEIV